MTQNSNSYVSLIHFLLGCHEILYMGLHIGIFYHVYMQPKFQSLMFRFGIFILGGGDLA